MPPGAPGSDSYAVLLMAQIEVSKNSSMLSNKRSRVAASTISAKIGKTCGSKKNKSGASGAPLSTKPRTNQRPSKALATRASACDCASASNSAAKVASTLSMICAANGNPQITKPALYVEEVPPG